jgi:hypothetical protein
MSAHPNRGPHGGWRRTLRQLASILLVALVVIELAYVIAANLILRTRSLDRWVTGATAGLSLKIDSGWTLWPARVHIKGLELHFEDYNVQFSVALDSAVVDLRLWQLPAKIFHVTRVRAEGVRYLLRHKVASAAGLERRLALYPKIPGYSDPPLFKGPHTPPLTDEQYNLWTIQLEDVDAGVKELWFLEYRFTGKGRARGGFRLEPERDARTQWCTLRLDGAMHAGEQTVATRLRGRIEAQLDRHDPRVVEGVQIFDKISFKTDLDADIPSLAFTELYATEDGPHLRGGRGELLARTDLRHGAWMKRTRLRYSTAALTVARERTIANGALELTAEIKKPGRDAELELGAVAPRTKFSFAGSPKAIDGPSMHQLRMTLGIAVNLTRETRPVSAEGRVALTAPDLRWLNYPLKAGETFTGGRARTSASFEWNENTKARVKLALELEDATFELAGKPLRSSGSADAVLVYDSQTQRGRFLRLAAELPRLDVGAKDAWKALPGGVQVRAERFGWHGLPPERFESRLVLDSETIEPLVPFVISSTIVRSIASALMRLGKTHAVIALDRSPAALQLNLEQARSGDVQAVGILLDPKGEEHPCGRFFVSSSKLSVGVVLYRGETSVKPFVSSNWWRERPPTESCGPTIGADPDPLAEQSRVRSRVGVVRD